jgi:outer membrane protein insertion porin family/translocation and assembly module TamA
MTGRGAFRAATLALFATVAIAVAPRGVDAQELSCSPGDKEVLGLDFRGNQSIRDADLAVRVTTTPSSRTRRWHLGFGQRRCLNHDELSRDVLRLTAYYRERGFYSARVDTVVQPLSASAVRVIFNIAEGQPTRVASYTVTGLQGIPDSADILHRLRLRVGNPFDFGLFRADIDTVVHRLREEGYYRADALSAYDRDTNLVARASITAIPGQRARFGVPEFLIDAAPGRHQEISEDVVQRVMRIRPGQLYSDQAILDAQRNLFQLGTYRHLEIAPLPDSLQPPGDSIVRLGVRLSEDYMRQLDSEIGWATLDCGRARLQYTDKNWLNTARRLEVNAQASKIGYGGFDTQATRDFCTLRWLGESNQTALKDDPFSHKLHYFLGATVRQPRLLGTRWVPAMSLYSERRGEFKAYLRSTFAGADVSATRDVADRMPLRLAYTFEYGATEADLPALCALFNRCDPQSRQTIQDTTTLGVASATLARIRTDNVLSPTRGYAMRAEVRSSAARLLGTSDSLFFNKGTGDVSWYTRLGGRSSVLAVRLRGGVVFGRKLSFSDPAGFIPPQERLYAGGPTSVRGFQQNELGSLVYIAGRGVDTVVTVPAGTTDTTFQFRINPTTNPDSSLRLDRSVPLGGNSLVVANVEYRMRDRFLFPDLLQYILFIDGGDVWSRETRRQRIKWTPGVGFRALTPVGPVLINVGYNRYDRDEGPLFYNPDVSTLLCVSPGNTITYQRVTGTESFRQTDETQSCPSSFVPPKRTRLLQKLTFTFSIGSDF